MPVKKQRVLKSKAGKAFQEHMSLLKMLAAEEGLARHKVETHPIIRKEEQLREAVQASSKYPFMAERIDATARILYNDLKRQALKVTGWDERKADRIVKDYILGVIREEYKRAGKRLPKGMRKRIEELG